MRKILRWKVELWNILIGAVMIGGLIAAVSAQVKHADTSARETDKVRELERIYYDGVAKRSDCVESVARSDLNRLQHQANAAAMDKLLTLILPDVFGFGPETVTKLNIAADELDAELAAGPLLSSEPRTLAECPPVPIPPPSLDPTAGSTPL